ncbi:MAG: hypothetical protein LUG89_04575 [Methanosphaera sp.]|nr:hypothetical protein [Methanosphaera sp.]
MEIKRNIKIELTKKQYMDFIQRILKYNKRHSHLPSEIDFDGVSVYKNEYIEAVENVNKFILENSRYPEKIVIYHKRHNQ